ncbi:MAG: alkaline phosphatase D family protein [Rubrivivax sp.]|jgi:alkaline phosphatase D|nr:alkaline phosphatase D family protein [Rubrivivax sp.]
MPLHNLLRDTALADPSRRRFVERGAAVLALAPLAGCLGGGGDDARNVIFTHGVASGDPLSDRVILWTRVRPQDAADNQPVIVRWEVSADASFAQLVSSGLVQASSETDFTVKVDATGLAPGQRYHYRFVGDGQTSTVGRTKTLPLGTVAQARLAVFSCSNYPAGYFHGYAEAAKRDLDAVLHLGDYLYEYAPGGYASAQAERMGRVVQPAREIVSLDDYRRRYAQYRTDADLQALHAAHPMIAVWDDHEITNDAWRNGAENHQPNEGDYAVRKAAALQAWHEWLPVRTGSARDQTWRRFDWGSLLSLHMLDTRIAGRDEQLDYANYITPAGFNAAGFTAAVSNPARQLLGSTQQAWLQQQLNVSGATWQVLGQQVLMGRMNIPAPILFEANQPGTGVTVSAYAALVGKAQAQPASLTAQERAILAQPAIPYNLDAWDGYAVARETVLTTAAQLNKNLVVLAGDTHNAWANDLRLLNGTAVGVEFATPSVTSPGFEEYLPNENPAFLAGSLAQLIDPLVWCDTARRGFLQLTVTPAACRADFVFVSNVFERNYTATTGSSWQVLAGQKRVVAA